MLLKTEASPLPHRKLHPGLGAVLSDGAVFNVSELSLYHLRNWDYLSHFPGTLRGAHELY